jgi:hypothetical protein
MPRHGLSHGSSAPGPIARGLAGRRLQQPAYGPAGRATPAGSAVRCGGRAAVAGAEAGAHGVRRARGRWARGHGAQGAGDGASLHPLPQSTPSPTLSHQSLANSALPPPAPHRPAPPGGGDFPAAARAGPHRDLDLRHRRPGGWHGLRLCTEGPTFRARFLLLRGRAADLQNSRTLPCGSRVEPQPPLADALSL